MNRFVKSTLLGGVCAIALTASAYAANFDIPNGDLETALDAFSAQTGIELIVSGAAVTGAHTRGAKGTLTANEALTRILSGTGFISQPRPSGAIAIVKQQAEASPARALQIADAEPVHAAAASVETVVVTSSKIKGDIQTVPIAITALSQEQLTSRQIAGGPDLVKEVPNLTFSKTNFTGYNIQIRGIGTQAISVTTDPAVAVALNDMPFIRNHFFEQEFFDVNQVEVLRGPQGTLYGRNATAGVVNVISAKPTDQFEAMLSADWGNYNNRRYEGMVNLPIVDDRLDLRMAAEWTKRDGYSVNDITGDPIDGRDLWSSRVTIGFNPSERLHAYLVWEHFDENDDRLRSSKQLCKTAPIPASVDGVPIPAGGNSSVSATDIGGYFTQGCLPDSLYDKGNPSAGDYGAFGVPNGFGLPYIAAGIYGGQLYPLVDPYASTSQSTNLRVIESTIDPHYRAKNDVIEFNADFNVTPQLTFTSQTGYSEDFLWSAEDYNRFNTSPGIFTYYDPNSQQGRNLLTTFDGNYVCNDGTVSIGTACASNNGGIERPAGTFCDPQLGCSDRLVAEDLSDEHAWQLSQEFRLASNFAGPLNFSIGGNYLHYETEENYYVFINALTAFTYGLIDSGIAAPWVAGVSDGHQCLEVLQQNVGIGGYQYPDLKNTVPNLPGDGSCAYVDPNSIPNVNNAGHNYFLSQNPYTLNSYAGFGEAYYQVVPTLKLVGGLRWTDDQKHFTDIPSELLINGYGYASTGAVDQQWNQLTGRFTANWTPKLDFTDQTLVYGSFAHGYKAGGANPPGAHLIAFEQGDQSQPVHPLTFKPEFIDAYELGTKNTLADGGLTLNGDIFFYNYTGYQISRIVDRTAINDNFNATVKGAELEAAWQPISGLKFNFAGGYEDTRIKNGQSSVDLMDRTAGTPGWMVIKPFIGQASNCILPDYVAAAALQHGLINSDGESFGSILQACGAAYDLHQDPVTDLAYDYGGPPTEQCNQTRSSSNGYVCDRTQPISGYAGFDPLSIDPNAPAGVNNGLGLPPNDGEGFSKNLGGNQLPNAPHFTVSLSGEYTLPVSENWAATLHSDFYWQSQSFARVFNDRPYDKIRGYSTTNVALILTSADGWQVMGYVKNVFNVTAITGDFLNSDDSGLTTNVFLTDPRLFGVRVTKNW